MTPTAFRQARLKLGLSVAQMAAMIGCKPLLIRRMEMRRDAASARPVSPMAARLVAIYLDGYRPPDWPR
jgi:ribosome-binding protein aMBF1 (putative translation factor)